MARVAYVDLLDHELVQAGDETLRYDGWKPVKPQYIGLSSSNVVALFRRPLNPNGEELYMDAKGQPYKDGDLWLTGDFESAHFRPIN